MSPLIHLLPLGLSALLWFGLAAANRRLGWLRLGEVIFWDVVILAVVFLVWLRFY